MRPLAGRDRSVRAEKLLPPGHKLPRPGRIEIRIGKPLVFDEFRDQPAGAKQRRAVTDRVMAAIGELSGQEYAPIYASVRKQQLAAAKDGTQENGVAEPDVAERDVAG